MLDGQPAPSRFEELYKKNKEKEGKLEQKREENSKNEIDSLNFKPAINQRSREIYKQKLL